MSSHLSEETLLLYLDGEMGSRAREAAARHLRECWECRTAAQRLDAAIHAFIEERRDDLAAAVSEGGRQDFDARLAQWAASRGPTEPVRDPRRIHFRRLWPVGLAAAALAAVEVWKPVTQYAKPPKPPEPPAIAWKAPRPPVLPQTATVLPPPTIAAPAPRRVDLPATAPPFEPGPTAADLDSAEVEAYAAVHRAGLCRGEDIEVLRVPGRSVRVSGVVEREQQRAALEAALAGVPFAESAVLAAPPGGMPAAEAAAPAVRLEPRPPLLRERLEAYFLRHAPANQAARAMNEFSNQAVLLASAARWEAQALHRLASAFPSRRIQDMAHAQRAVLHTLIGEHRRELELGLAQLGRLLDRLEDPAEATGLGPQGVAPTGWAEGCGQLDQEAARLDALTGALFAGLELPGQDAAQAWRELREARARALRLLEAAAAAAERDFQVAALPEAVKAR